MTDAPKEGFASQIVVTVSIALLVDWAATSNLIAAKVLCMLLTGRVGDEGDWSQVRKRLGNIKKGVAKHALQPAGYFSPQSVKQRLESPFWMPLATSYPNIMTHDQQAKADAPVTSGQSKCQHS
jgi:hypothetical protein